MGAGVLASFMVSKGISSTREALNFITDIQARVKLYTPIQWTISGKLIPPT